MKFVQSSDESLRRIFMQGFTVMDVAEPLISFDAGTPAGDLRAFMERRNLQRVGVRTSGIVTGTISLSQLPEDGEIGEGTPITRAEILSSSASLAETVIVLKSFKRALVSVLGQVGGIVSRTDIQKPPARMWLFGMITLIEMRFSALIEHHCERDTWMQFLSDGRIDQAKQLQTERRRRNQAVDLLSCLQFSDKMQIIARSSELRSQTRFESRRQTEQTGKMLQKLRNNLAHTQDIVTEDWDTIVVLTEHLDVVLEGPPGLRNDRAD